MSSEEACEFEKRATTLDITIIPECEPIFSGSTGSYFKLQYTKGQKCVRRKDLICDTNYPSFKGDKCMKCNFTNCKCDKKQQIQKIKCDKCRENKCLCKSPIKELATFVQISDIHLIDSTSPSRSSFLGVFIESIPVLSDSFRAYESLTMQVAECMVRKINSVERGPHLGEKFKLVVSTGDNSDSETLNEIQSFINMLDGTEIVPNPASKIYTGVQDNQPSPAYEFYYHPDPTPPGLNPDIYKTQFGYPDFPNILNSSVKPFCASGLKVPWYSSLGNHENTKMGNFPLFNYAMMVLFDQIATGEIPNNGSKLIEYMSPIMAMQFAEALQKQDAAATLDIINKSVLREIPKSDKRRQFTKADFIAAHFNTTKLPGKIGHGFDQRNIDLNVAYYTFQISETVTGIMLDSTNPSGNLLDINLAPNGSYGRVQMCWLEAELRKRHSNFYNNQGELVCTDNKDELIIVFAHHSLETLNNVYNSPETFDNDPQRILGEDFIQILHRYPNIIAYICGHEHLNRITPYKDPTGRSQGFWQVISASHIDFPQQSRIVEIGEHGDLISIYGTMIDHQSPANVGRGTQRKSCCSSHSGCNSLSESSESNSENRCEETYTIAEMASISRELSYNDKFIVDEFDDAVQRTGTPKDRNVELLLFNPLKRCKPCKK